MVSPGNHWVAATWLWVDFDNPKNPGLPVEFGYWNTLASDEPMVVTPQDCFVACLSMSEGKKPAVAIVLQFATPLFLGPKAANTVAVPVLLPRSVIQPMIRRERQH